MNDNFGYIDIVLLAIVAGIIILRLRNVLGKGAEDGAVRAKKLVVEISHLYRIIQKTSLLMLGLLSMRKT